MDAQTKNYFYKSMIMLNFLKQKCEHDSDFKNQLEEHLKNEILKLQGEES